MVRAGDPFVDDLFGGNKDAALGDGPLHIVPELEACRPNAGQYGSLRVKWHGLWLLPGGRIVPLSSMKGADTDERAGEVEQAEHRDGLAVVADRETSVGKQPTNSPL